RAPRGPAGGGSAGAGLAPPSRAWAACASAAAGPVPEDRFADLGPSGEQKPSAAERLAELDEREPEEQPKPPEPSRPGGRYTWVVGIAFVIAIIVAGANALRHSGAGYRGIPAGRPLAP